MDKFVSVIPKETCCCCCIFSLSALFNSSVDMPVFLYHLDFIPDKLIDSNYYVKYMISSHLWQSSSISSL